MATVSHFFHPGAGHLASSAFPKFDKIAGTNFPVPVLAYDASSAEFAYWEFRAVRYGSGNLTIDVDWYADTATTGNVVWSAAVAAMTPDTDTTDVETKAFATANTVTDAHLGTTGQRLHRVALTVTNLDSLAADDLVTVKFGRSPTGNTLAGDALLRLATLSYSDT